MSAVPEHDPGQVKIPPPPAFTSWRECAYEQNSRAARLASEAETLRLEADAAQAELAALTKRHDDFRAALIKSGDLRLNADEAHIVNAMRHARANRLHEEADEKSARVRLQELTDGLHGLLNVFPVEPGGAGDATLIDDLRRALTEGRDAARQRDEAVRQRDEDRAAADDWVAGLNRALGLPVHMSPVNTLNRVTALVREVRALRATAEGSVTTNAEGASAPAAVSAEDALAVLKRAGQELIDDLFGGGRK